MVLRRLPSRCWRSIVSVMLLGCIGCTPTEEVFDPVEEPGQYHALATALAWLNGSADGRLANATASPQLFVSETGRAGAKPGSGVTYLYQQSGNTWKPVKTLFDANAVGSQYFGVSIATRGNDVMIGGPLASTTGQAFVFIRSGSTWTQQATLQAADREANDGFGQRVAIDGDWALVAAPYEDEAAPTAGAVYAFKRTGTTWAQTQKLMAATPDANDVFGQSLILNETEALIGSSDTDNYPNPYFGGRVHVWTRASNTWTEGTTLRPSDASSSKNFGAALARSGNWLVVGAPNDGQTAGGAGAAYVFERVGSNWVERQKLRADDGKPNEHFGGAVSIDGEKIAIGAKDAAGKVADSGAVYVFELDGTWKQIWKLVASDGKTEDAFGTCCAISGDFVAVGAPDATVNGKVFAGKGYVYTLPQAPAPARVLTEVRKIGTRR